MEISKRIIEARKAKKWTQKDLAKAINVNIKNISRWELDQSKPSIDAAVTLAKALGVSVDFLCGIKTNNTSSLHALFSSKEDNLSVKQKEAIRTVLEAF